MIGFVNFLGDSTSTAAALRWKLRAMRRCSGLCLLALCMVPSRMPAQLISEPSPQPGTITGTVEDLSGGIVPGATVGIESTSLEKIHNVTTDSAGFFSLSDVPSTVAVHLVVHTGRRHWSAWITTGPELARRGSMFATYEQGSSTGFTRKLQTGLPAMTNAKCFPRKMTTVLDNRRPGRCETMVS